MRTVWLLLLVLAAAGGLWYLLATEEEGPRTDRDWGDDDAAAVDDVGPGDGMRTAGALRTVAVLGEPIGGSMPPIEHGRAVETVLEFPAGAEGLTGAEWLTAIESQAGRTVPLLFVSRRELEAFKKTKLLREPPPSRTHVQDTLDWIHARGFDVKFTEGRMMIHRRREP